MTAVTVYRYDRTTACGRSGTDLQQLLYHETLAFSNERFAAVCATADAREGVGAFLDGDPPGPEGWPGK